MEVQSTRPAATPIFQKTVGQFTYDSADGQIVGPAAYMRTRGAERLARIERGDDVVVEHGLRLGHDALTLVLVSLQTDYAAYLGQQQIERQMSSRS